MELFFLSDSIHAIIMDQRKSFVLLPRKSHGWRSLVGCSPWSRWALDTTEWLPFHFSLSCIGEGKDNPLQCSCLQNPRDRGAWWVFIYGVAQSQTWLSSSSRTTLDPKSTEHHEGRMKATQKYLLKKKKELSGLNFLRVIKETSKKCKSETLNPVST